MESTIDRRIEHFLKKTEFVSVFLVMLCCSMYFYFSATYEFSFISLATRKIFVAVPIALWGTMRTSLSLLLEYRANDKKRVVKKAGIIVFCFIPCIVLMKLYGYNHFMYIGFCALCLYGIEAEKVLKAYVVTVGTLLAATVLCSLAEAIPNYTYIVEGRIEKGTLRSSYGIYYPTDFASYLVFIILCFWSCNRDNKWWNIITILISCLFFAYLSYYYAMSRTSVLCLFLCGFMAVFEWLERRALSQKKIGTALLKVKDNVFIWLFPVLGMFFYISTWLYGQGNSFAQLLDTIGHSRIHYAWMSYEKYGVHLFGALTPQNGFGGGEIFKFASTGYDFLDSTYALILIRYGLLLTGVLFYLWPRSTQQSMKGGNRCLAYTMGIIAILSFSEHHFTELNYNIILALPLCSFSTKSASTEYSKKGSGVGWVYSLTGFAIICCGILILPKLLSCLRTIFQLKGWTEGQDRSGSAVLSCLVIVLTAGLLWFSISKTLIAIIQKSSWRPSAAKLLLVTGAAVCMCVMGNTVINQADSENSIIKDSAIINEVLGSAKEPVYSAQAEELYKRNYSGFSDRLFSMEELCRYRKGSMITNKNEAYKLISTGALYAELNENSGIYSYDEEVINALSAKGFDFRNYYYSVNEVDLGSAARKNDLPIQEGSIALAGEGHALVEQSDISLYQGRYLAYYSLSVNPSMLRDNQMICNVRITSHEGAKEIIQQEVSASDFDEDGHLTLTLPIAIGNRPNVWFQVMPVGDVTVFIDKISWKRNPS